MEVDKGDLQRFASRFCSPPLRPLWARAAEHQLILLRHAGRLQVRDVTTGHEYVCRLTDGPCSVIAMGEKAHEAAMLHAELLLILAPNVLSHTTREWST